MAAVRNRANKLVANRLVNSVTELSPQLEVSEEPQSIEVKSATISVQELTIRADKLVLMVDNFAPAFNLSPTIDVTSPDVRVEVASPNVNVDVQAPNVNVTNQVPSSPVPDAPSIINQVTIPSPEIKEVSVTLNPPNSGDCPKPKTKTITVTAPDGKKYTGTIREIED